MDDLINQIDRLDKAIRAMQRSAQPSRHSNPTRPRCSFCGRLADADGRRCSHCGAPLG
jgi:predicted amidophosphoribosyltransferase